MMSLPLNDGSGAPAIDDLRLCLAQAKERWGGPPSVALPPIIDLGDGATIVLPFAARVGDDDGDVVLGELTGYIRWSWPALLLTERRVLPTANHTCQGVAGSTTERRPELEAQLLDGLDVALRSASIGDLSSLSGLYSLFVPPHLVREIHQFFPTTTRWLGEAQPEDCQSSVPAAASQQLQPKLRTWADRLSGLLGDDRFAIERQQLDAISARLYRGGRPYVVMAGEAGRGKSTCVNMLLGGDVLPSEPTTSIVRLSVDAAPYASEHAWIQVDAPVLRELGVDLVDAPAADDGPDVLGLRALLLGAAATIVVVSATSPLGMSERRQLEQLAVDGAGERVVIAISKLDRIEPDERDAVVDSIATRVHRTLPRVQVVSTLDARRLSTVVGTVTKASVAEVAFAIGTAEALADVAGRLATAASEDASRQALDDRRRHELTLAEDRRIIQGRLVLDRLGSELVKQRLDAGARVQSSLASSANKTVQQLEVDLRSAGEPAAWWSKELVPALMRDIDGAGRMVERRILSASHESLDWLSNELRENLGIHPLVLRPNAVQIDHLRTPSSGERALRHVTTLQHAPGVIAGSLFAARIAIVGALASVLPSVAIAGATYVATRAFSRASIGRAIDEATREIPPLVEEAFGELESVSMTELDRVYAELAADLDRLVADWPATAAPADELAQDQSVHLREVADAASDLEAQIREFLASHEEKASP